MQIAETNLAFRSKLTRRSRTSYIVLHHAGASRCTVYDVHQWHLNRVEPDGTRWLGIGYHFFVDKAGRVYRGRPQDTVGAHCPGYNANSVGICCEGNYEWEYMPPAQWKAVLELIEELKRMYPRAKVVGHRDLIPTKCPGQFFPLAELKAGRGPVERRDTKVEQLDQTLDWQVGYQNAVFTSLVSQIPAAATRGVYCPLGPV